MIHYETGKKNKTRLLCLKVDELNLELGHLLTTDNGERKIRFSANILTSRLTLHETVSVLLFWIDKRASSYSTLTYCNTHRRTFSRNNVCLL